MEYYSVVYFWVFIVYGRESILLHCSTVLQLLSQGYDLYDHMHMCDILFIVTPR